MIKCSAHFISNVNIVDIVNSVNIEYDARSSILQTLRNVKQRAKHQNSQKEKDKYLAKRKNHCLQEM